MEEKLRKELKLNVEFSFLEILLETINGYVFWCLFQALAPMIWFYPLNELDITGYEAYALVLFSPLLLCSAPLRRMLSSWRCMAVLRLASVLCLASLRAPDTLSRLLFLCEGCGCVMVTFTVSMWAPSKRHRELNFWGLILGLLTFIGSRIWWRSFVPVWWNNECNSVIIAVGLIGAFAKISQADDDTPWMTDYQSRSTDLTIAAALGSQFFLIHSVFGEVSLVTRWSVNSYPDTGPLPNPWGALVFIMLVLGVIVSPKKGILRLMWFVLGCANFCVFYYYKSWTSYTGGLLVACFAMSNWRPLVSASVTLSPIATVTVAILTWLFEMLFYVWTVAYNFVPGGFITRERTDILMAIVLISIGAGLYKVLLILTVVSLSGFYGRELKPNHRIVTQQEDQFSCAIWTFHFGYDNQGWQSLERAAKFLKETDADVITLLESDASKPFLGNNDLSMWMSEELEMYVDFGPSTKDHTWGNLLLSKYPIVQSEHHLLPSPEGELAPAVTATINMTGHLVDFVVTHMGNDGDVLDRELQARVLAKHLRQAKNPVVFMGYITSEPESRDYNHILKQGKVNDIDDLDVMRWCEYIFYRGLIRLAYGRISHGGLSDTELQIAKFRIPQNPAKFIDHYHMTLNSDRAPEKDRFNPIFGGFRHGHNKEDNHLFHMSSPKFFLPDPSQKVTNEKKMTRKKTKLIMP